MTLKELLNQNFEVLSESINDKPLFKAIVTAGSPGGGKSFITKIMFSTSKWLNAPNNVTVINSDVFFELGLEKAGLPKVISLDDKELYKAQMEVRDNAKRLTSHKLGHAINNMNCLLIDGTGANFEKTKAQIEGLRSMGYDVSMIFINTPLEAAQARNARRERSLDPKIIDALWNRVNDNLPKYKALLGDDLYVVDNQENEKDSEEDKAFKDKLYKLGQKILEKPLQNPLGRAIIETLKATGGRYITDLPDKEERKKTVDGIEKTTAR